MDADAEVSRFLKHLESERRLSARTVVSYRKDLKDLGLLGSEASEITVSNDTLRGVPVDLVAINP